VEVALNVASLARQHGFDVWLDVLDPILGGLQPRRPAYSWPIACIIEMALLNSTHLVAVMTTDTNGSQWVPYEFGRVKVDQVITSNSSSLLVELALTDVPEYLLLCPVHETKDQFIAWLQRS
jgi:hypothetical protein